MWALTYQLEAAENDRHQTRVRGQVLLKLSALRADLESTLNRLAYIDESIALYVSLNPTITQQRYELLARSIMNGVAGVNHLALIKGTTIKNIYPFAQNMRAIGLDLLNNPATAQAIQKVMASRKPVLAGPLEDKGNDYPGVFIVLRPIYLAAGTAYAAKGSYLGVCAVVIDQKYVYRSAGLETKYSQLNIAIKGSNAQGEAGGMFYGSADVFAMGTGKTKGQRARQRMGHRRRAQSRLGRRISGRLAHTVAQSSGDFDIGPVDLVFGAQSHPPSHDGPRGHSGFGRRPGQSRKTRGPAHQ